MGIESGKVENECTEKENIQENVGAEKVHEITTVETNAHMHMARSAEENQLSPASDIRLGAPNIVIFDASVRFSCAKSREGCVRVRILIRQVQHVVGSGPQTGCQRCRVHCETAD